MPTVSLIVPVYNAAAYLEAGVRALLRQSCSDIEVILVDDGSTDGSGALCDRFGREDARVHVLHKQNGGAGSARNAGIDAATGDWLMFPDADDCAAPTLVEELLAAAERDDADVAICGFDSFDDPFADSPPREQTLLPAAVYEGEEVRQFFTGYFPLGVVGYPWNKLYRASLVRENGLRFPDMRRFQDGVFNLDVFEHARRVTVVERALYRYKLNDLSGIFQKFPANIFDLLCQITDAYYEKLDAWGLRSERAEREIRPFFLNGVVGCIDCLYSPAWGCDRAARRAYLEMLAENPTFQHTFAASAELYGLSRYAAGQVRRLAAGRYGAVLRTARYKLVLKKNFNRLFRLLRDRG